MQDASGPPSPAQLPPLAACTGGTLSSGALYSICTPTLFWNGGLVLFAPGIEAPFPDANTPGPLPTIDSDVQQALTLSGYAVARTGFRGTGLAVVPDWIDDLTELVAIFEQVRGKPRRTYLTGGSQGGLITTLAVEQHPEIFSGGLAACGPIGDYRKQIDYLGDFRVVFDDLIGFAIPSWPIWTQQLGGYVDPRVWIQEPTSQAAVAGAIATFPDKTQQLLKVTGAPSDRAEVQNTVLHVLSYSFLFTNDLIDKAGGLPYGNNGRQYSGSANDKALNHGVVRFTPSPTALDYIEKHFQTSGKLRRPLVTLHTTGDEIVPSWHEDLYRKKLLRNGSLLLHANWKVQRYGHCNFTSTEMLSAFALLVFRVNGQNMLIARDALPSPAARAEVLRLAWQYGAVPEIVDRSVIALRARP